MERGNVYELLMSTSRWFAQLREVEDKCRVTMDREKYTVAFEELEAANSMTCEEYAMAGNKALMEAFMPSENLHDDLLEASAFFKQIAYFYSNGTGMCMSCQSMEQAWNAWWAADVTNNKMMIQYMGGDFSKCLELTQTSWNIYATGMMDYMQMNITALGEDFGAMYDFESELMDACMDRKLPARSQFNNFGKCMNTWAEMSIYDMYAKALFWDDMSLEGETEWDEVYKATDTIMKDYAMQFTYCNTYMSERYTFHVKWDNLSGCEHNMMAEMKDFKRLVGELDEENWVEVFLAMSRLSTEAAKEEELCGVKVTYEDNQQKKNDTMLTLTSDEFETFVHTPQVKKLVFE